MSYAKVLLGLVISFITGAGCQLLRIPVPAPPVLSGALLVFAMSVGYWLVDRAMKQRAAQHKHLCGGHAVGTRKEG